MILDQLSHWVQSEQIFIEIDSPGAGLPYVHVATHVVHVGSTLQPHGISHAGQVEHDEYPNGHWSGQADDQAGHPEQVVLMTCSLSRGRSPRAWFGFGFPWVVLKVWKAGLQPSNAPKTLNFGGKSSAEVYQALSVTSSQRNSTAAVEFHNE